MATNRPKSIVQFELCYLGAVAIGAVNTALSWTATTSSVEAAQTEAMLGAWFLPLLAVFGFSLSLLLWYFTARVPSQIAKWVLVALFVLGAIGFLFTLLVGVPPTGLSGVLGIVALLLNGFAVWLLLRAESAAWFARA